MGLSLAVEALWTHNHLNCYNGQHHARSDKGLKMWRTDHKWLTVNKIEGYFDCRKCWWTPKYIILFVNLFQLKSEQRNAGTGSKLDIAISVNDQTLHTTDPPLLTGCSVLRESKKKVLCRWTRGMTSVLSELNEYMWMWTMQSTLLG